MKKILFFLCFIALGLTSCNNKSKNVDEENISYIEKEDKEVNTAMDKAKNTFDQFEKVFIENQKTNKYANFMVKEGFPTKDGSKEHVWITKLTYNGRYIAGIVATQPLYEIKVQRGDTVIIDRNLISDWMYIDNATNQTYGCYVTRVLVNRMTDEGKAAFLQKNGFDFAPLVE